MDINHITNAFKVNCHGHTKSHLIFQMEIKIVWMCIFSTEASNPILDIIQYLCFSIWIIQYYNSSTKLYLYSCLTATFSQHLAMAVKRCQDLYTVNSSYHIKNWWIERWKSKLIFADNMTSCLSIINMQLVLWHYGWMLIELDLCVLGTRTSLIL